MISSIDVVGEQWLERAEADRSRDDAIDQLLPELRRERRRLAVNELLDVLAHGVAVAAHRQSGARASAIARSRS